jgi:hypothetical protein
VAKLPFIIEGYKPENMAKGDETGLYCASIER